jgi:hypothetical protein
MKDNKSDQCSKNLGAQLHYTSKIASRVHSLQHCAASLVAVHKDIDISRNRNRTHHDAAI